MATKEQRESILKNIVEYGSFPLLMNRLTPTGGWAQSHYGIPEYRHKSKGIREFQGHPSLASAWGNFTDFIVTKLAIGSRIEAVLTAGTRVDRPRRGSNKPSPHSINADPWCTAIDIDGFLYRNDDTTLTSYVVNQNTVPHKAPSDDRPYEPGYVWDVSYVLPLPETAYWRVACHLTLFFGRVIHCAVPGYTGRIHQDHFHCDMFSEVMVFKPRSKSQVSLIQSVINTFFEGVLVVDGKFGPKTEAAMVTVTMPHDGVNSTNPLSVQQMFEHIIVSVSAN